MNLRVDPARLHIPPTNIDVRAQRPDGAWDTVDIAHLDRASLDTWLRSRESIDWPIDVVMHLLGHEPSTREEEVP